MGRSGTTVGCPQATSGPVSHIVGGRGRIVGGGRHALADLPTYIERKALRMRRSWMKEARHGERCCGEPVNRAPMARLRVQQA